LNILDTNTPALRVAVYARYSSDNQRDESIDAQIRACKYFAQKSNYAIVKTYIDKAKSGTTVKGRTEFLQMIDDSDKGIFDIVVVHRLNRFGRDGLDTLKYKKILEKNGIALVSVTEKLDNSPEGKLMLMVLTGINEFYSANLSNEVMKGMKENAFKCVHTGGKPPLGYDVDPDTKKLIINENEAKIVRIIFEMYADGKGYNQILNHLNGLNYKTKRGQPFGKNSLYSILHNEKYVGNFIFNKSSSAAADGTRNSHKYKPDDEIIRIEGGCPAIVDREIFDKVQLKTTANLKGAGRFKAKETYLISPVVYCECGRKMVGNTRMAGRGKSKYSSYRCASKVQHQGCDNKELRKEYADNYVLDMLYENLFSDDSIKKLSRMLSEYNEKKTIENHSDLDTYQRQLEETKRKITNIITLVSEAEIEVSTVKMSAINEDMVNILIEKARDFVREKNLPECRNVIENYIDRVIISKDDVKVIFRINVTDSNQDIVPLITQEAIKTLQREYRNSANSH
jgi:site-specific DNA recombinase